jgi:hypothetical protein
MELTNKGLDACCASHSSIWVLEEAVLAMYMWTATHGLNIQYP